MLIRYLFSSEAQVQVLLVSFTFWPLSGPNATICSDRPEDDPSTLDHYVFGAHWASAHWQSNVGGDRYGCYCLSNAITKNAGVSLASSKSSSPCCLVRIPIIATPLPDNIWYLACILRTHKPSRSIVVASVDVHVPTRYQMHHVAVRFRLANGAARSC